jgi:hypothetical protein
MTHDAVALIRSDHRTVEKLFKEFEQAGDRAHKTKLGEEMLARKRQLGAG